MSQTRRSLLRSAAAVAAIGGAVPAMAAGPDARLLALCAAFHAIHAEAEATTADADLTATHARRWAVSAEIETTPALTPAGKAAKARVALHLLQECGDTAYPGSWERLVTVALAEAAGLPVPPAAEDADIPPRPLVLAHPDTALLAACAAADAVQKRQDALWTGPMRVEDDGERDRLLAPMVEEQEAHLDDVFDLPALTLAGHQARAATLALWDKELMKPGGGGWDELLVVALVRDLVAGARA